MGSSSSSPILITNTRDKLEAKYQRKVDAYARMLEAFHYSRKLNGKPYLDNWGKMQEARMYMDYLTSKPYMDLKCSERAAHEAEWILSWRKRAHERRSWARVWDDKHDYKRDIAINWLNCE